MTTPESSNAQASELLRKLGVRTETADRLLRLLDQDGIRQFATLSGSAASIRMKAPGMSATELAADMGMAGYEKFGQALHYELVMA